jgi:hypothetical protein
MVRSQPDFTYMEPSSFTAWLKNIMADENLDENSLRKVWKDHTFHIPTGDRWTDNDHIR